MRKGYFYTGLSDSRLPILTPKIKIQWRKQGPLKANTCLRKPMLCFQPLGCKENPLYTPILQVQTKSQQLRDHQSNATLIYMQPAGVTMAWGSARLRKTPRYVMLGPLTKAFPNSCDIKMMSWIWAHWSPYWCPATWKYCLFRGGKWGSGKESLKKKKSLSVIRLVLKWRSFFLPSFLGLWSQHFILLWELLSSFLHRTRRSSVIPIAPMVHQDIFFPSNEP